jgi:hypothetical protein
MVLDRIQTLFHNWTITTVKILKLEDWLVLFLRVLFNVSSTQAMTE